VVYEKIDEEDDRKRVLDRFSVANQPTTTAEGYRLLWFHSTRKAELDALARAHRIQRATRELDDLRRRLGSPRTVTAAAARGPTPWRRSSKLGK
jgi:hypothetical protein